MQVNLEDNINQAELSIARDGYAILLCIGQSIIAVADYKSIYKCFTKII